MSDPQAEQAKRELVGLAKLRILKLRRELGEYLQEIYPQVAAANETIMDDVMVEAMQEILGPFHIAGRQSPMVNSESPSNSPAHESQAAGGDRQNEGASSSGGRRKRSTDQAAGSSKRVRTTDQSLSDGPAIKAEYYNDNNNN